MTTYDLPRELRRLAIENGSLACLGCGLEYNCDSIHGCRVLRDAADEIQVLKAMLRVNDWISVEDRLPSFGVPVLVARRGINGKLKVEQGSKEPGPWWKVYGTLVKQVLYWQPMPEAPEEGEL